MKAFRLLPAPFHALIVITLLASPLASAHLLSPSEQETVQNAVGLKFSSNTLIPQYINYYQGRGRATMETGLRRSGRFLTIARKIFRDVGVPEDIAWLAQVESSWNPSYSNLGRAGLWQLSLGIGKSYGLRQTAWLDERKSFEKATRASASYLKDLARRYNGNWELAIAAYKAGEDSTNRAIKRAGSANFWMDYPYLPEDSRNTVPRVLATILIAKNPEKYGFNNIRPDEPLAYDVVNLPSATNLLLIASAADTSIDDIRSLNPELGRDATPPGEAYNVRVPAGRGKVFVSIIKHVPTDVRTLWTSVPESIRQSLPKAVIVNEVKDDFDLSAEQLPPNYRGVDITKLYDNYITRKQTAQKDEFETTEQFRQRVKQEEARPSTATCSLNSARYYLFTTL